VNSGWRITVTMSTASISPVFATALAHAMKKGVDATVARDELEPGVYRDIKVDLSITIGEMRVAPDTDKSPTCSIPMLPAMALLVRRMGLQRDEALKTLREVMGEAIALKSDASSKLLAETGVLEAEEMLRTEVIAKLPRTPVKGAVKVDNVEVTFKSMQGG
jgi:hypothetical protein